METPAFCPTPSRRWPVRTGVNLFLSVLFHQRCFRVRLTHLVFYQHAFLRSVCRFVLRFLPYSFFTLFKRHQTCSCRHCSFKGLSAKLGFLELRGGQPSADCDFFVCCGSELALHYSGLLLLQRRGLELSFLGGFSLDRDLVRIGCFCLLCRGFTSTEKCDTFLLMAISYPCLRRAGFESSLRRCWSLAFS